MTLREAIAKSLNVPTVKLAEMVGYDNVESLAKRAGMNLSIRPTPAIALGAYEVTPIEVAGAYTIYVDRGEYVKPNWVSLIRDREGAVLYSHKPERRQVLDPRVAYLMVNLMQEVLRSGTGAAVRSRGFLLPSAGKTGTSHDGWFVGFTSKLICAVWVGFDDNRELGLEGAHSALPVWTEFMIKAHEGLPIHDFQVPEGVEFYGVDRATGLAGGSFQEAFVKGTKPPSEAPVLAIEGESEEMNSRLLETL